MRSSVLALCVTAFTVSCASQQKAASTAGSPAAPAQANKAQSGADAGTPEQKRALVCTYDTPSGSHIPEKTCRYADEVDAQRQETQDSIRAYRNPNTHSGN